MLAKAELKHKVWVFFLLKMHIAQMICLAFCMVPLFLSVSSSNVNVHVLQHILMRF